MERSITVSAPASRAALILRSSVAGQLHRGEVPMLAFTLMREGWPTRMGLRLGCAGLPSSTIVPASMASTMDSGASCSSSARLVMVFVQQAAQSGILRTKRCRHGCASRVATQGAKKATSSGTASWPRLPYGQCELRQVHRVWVYPTLSRQTLRSAAPLALVT